MSSTWETKPFEKCIERVKKTPKIKRRDFLDQGDYPIVSQEAGLVNGYWNREGDLFKVPSPVVIFGDHTKAFKYVDFDFVLGADGVKILKPRDFLLPRFFFYQLQVANLDSLGYARHYRLLKELEITYPDRTEQQRIVALLDEAFDGLATATAHAEQNLANARALFESHLDAVFTEGGEGWTETTLGKACENLDRRRVPITKKDRVAGDYPYYGASGIVDHVSDYLFNEDLLLVSEDGANLLARTYPIAFSVSGKVWVNNHAHVLRFDALISQRFAEYYLNSISLEPYVSGMAQPKLNQRALNSITIPSPPISQQEAIVGQLDALAEETQRLEALYQQKLDALAELKQSLLHQAFSGQL